MLQSRGLQRVRHDLATEQQKMCMLSSVQSLSHVHAAAAAAAKSPQSCLTLCDPIDGSPPGSPCPWDSPGKNTGVGCHFLLQCMKVKSLSCVQLFETRWTAAYQAPLSSMGFSTKEYWSGLLIRFSQIPC